MKRKHQRAKLVKRAMRLVWDSLDSHLPLTHASPKKRAERVGGRGFHKLCVKEYVELIGILSKLH